MTWFPKAERLSEEEFLHGWHEVHTPHSAELHPPRWSYVRDTVVRTLTPGSPPVRAIALERFAPPVVVVTVKSSKLAMAPWPKIRR